MPQTKRTVTRTTIAGKVYDIYTAHKLATYSGIDKRCEAAPDDNAHRVSEALYRTKRGNYFLFGSGGICTRYGGVVCDIGTTARKIIPIQAWEAAMWCEQTRKIDLLQKDYRLRRVFCDLLRVRMELLN